MTALHRLTAHGYVELNRHLAAGGSIPPSPAPGSGWFEPCPGVSADAFDRWLDSVMAADPLDDAAAAASLHAMFQPPRALACDRMMWSWLAAFRGARYTVARWAKDSRLPADRVGRNTEDNALARLWWGAEHTRVDNVREVRTALEAASSSDVYAFTHDLFSNYELVNSVLKRLLAQSRPAVAALIAAVVRRGLSSAEIAALIRFVHLCHSTVIVEAFGGDGPGPYTVDPRGCARLVDLYGRLADETLGPVPAKEAGAGSTTSEGRDPAGHDVTGPGRSEDGAIVDRAPGRRRGTIGSLIDRIRRRRR